MPDYSFLTDPLTKQWVSSAPKRSHRTNVGGKSIAICPFCPGHEAEETELYRIGGKEGDSDWQIRVIPNKFPFAPHHEIIIHSPDHHKSFDELPFSQVELILKVYRHQYQVHRNDGAVYIFNNSGLAAGESLPHPHTQLVVIPNDYPLQVPPLDLATYDHLSDRSDMVLQTDYFALFCPLTSEWPDEVWIAPKRQGVVFGDASGHEISDLAFVLSRLVMIYDVRYGHEFAFNFYINPYINWYLRIIPRIKILGGFELGTKVMVNTQDPRETFAFIKEHFWQPDVKKIKEESQAEYRRGV